MKEWTDKYNPFNSDKLLAHVDTWRKIREGADIPAPITVSVDPYNGCDLKCSFCNADYRLNENRGKLERETLGEVSDFLADWGVRTICVGGGGESLLNKYSGEFITQSYNNGIGVGIVTNGTQISKNLEDLLNCTWVGVSVDAGNAEAYKEVKGSDQFHRVVRNMESLANLSQRESCELGKPGRGHGVSYKYLLMPENVGGIYDAARIAKAIGARNMHIRPGSPPWDKPKDPLFNFTPDNIDEFQEQLSMARELEDDNFGVFGVTHKFNGDLTMTHGFDKCKAIFMNGVIMPPTSNGKFDLGFCCDRRGDDILTIRDLESTEQIEDFWGSQEHWDMFRNIKVNECPRCTYQPHNKIFENVIEVNNMTQDFI